MPNKPEHNGFVNQSELAQLLGTTLEQINRLTKRGTITPPSSKLRGLQTKYWKLVDVPKVAQEWKLWKQKVELEKEIPPVPEGRERCSNCAKGIAVLGCKLCAECRQKGRDCHRKWIADGHCASCSGPQQIGQRCSRCAKAALARTRLWHRNKKVVDQEKHIC